MTFEPKTEEEIAVARLLPRGQYQFRILEAWEKKSQAGNEMIELKIHVSNGNGLSRTLADYLVSNKRPEKLRHCCEACGLLPEYTSGSLSQQDFIGKAGRLRLGIERGKKTERGKFSDRNVVEDYIST